MGKIVEIGNVPWSDDEMRSAFGDFKEMYLQKPISDNEGGMKAPHAFATWYMLRNLQPDLIVESGVWKGQGTWLIEQACPDAAIICLDISFKNLVYESPDAEYIEEDFSYVDFTRKDKSNALCFFDDHQNALTRLQQMKWKGFGRAIFEDNYPKLRGDCYSLKKIFGDHGFEKETFVPASLPGKIKYAGKQLLRANTAERIRPNSTHRLEVHQNLKTYYEAPPLFKSDKTRWGDTWNSSDYPSKEPLFDATFEDELRDEELHYNWMCFVELK